MAMRSKLRFLAENDREELHALIRRNYYGGVDEILAWIGGKGLKISRSSVYRYATRLRLADASAGRTEARMAVQVPEDKRTRRLLLQRLGALELERCGLIHELGLIEAQALREGEPAEE